MTTTTISVTDAPFTPVRTDECTNYLVRVMYEYDIVDFVVFGPRHMSETKLLSEIQRQVPRDEATCIIRFVQL